MNDKTFSCDSDELSELLINAVNQGKNLKDIHQVSDEMLNNVYAHAYKFYHQGRLDDAERFFSFLCMYDLNNPDYFLGLGAVNQLKKNYQKACDFYSLAYVLSGTDFTSVFYSGQCQLMMGNLAKSMQCFDLICKRCSDEALVSKAKTYLETIRKNIKEDDISEGENKDE